jgi:L-lactate dehydrogenase (cytochrome)
LARCFTIDDLRRAARRRLPRAVFDYVDGGTEDEVTMRRNRAAFEELELEPRVLRDVSDVDPSTTVLGRPIPLPVVLAPTGMTRLTHWEGELAVARAAARVGLPYVLSTMATTSIERVAAVGAPLWFQLYVWRDRGLCRELVDRARAAGCHALVLTVDTPVAGARERDFRNGLTVPPTVGLRTLLDGARRPAWWWRFLTSEALSFDNVRGRVEGPATLAYVASQFDQAVTWDDVAWLRDIWDGPLVLKGVVSPADAKQAVAMGVAGIVVSNHGGRQLDHVPATIDALPRVVDAVGGETEVLVDSGVRRGVDVAKALALGARAVMVGRAYLYGLGVAGEDGVVHAVRLLEGELRRAMSLLGTRAIGELDASYVRRRGTW